MKWHIITPTGHHVHLDVSQVELIALTNAGVGLHQHFVSPDDLEITGASPPGWQALQAHVQQLDERTSQVMSALDRITASVANVAAAVGGLADRVTAVSAAVKAHPAAAGDDAELNALADQLDNISSEMTAAAADLKQTADTVNSGNAQVAAGDTGGTPTTSGADATATGTADGTATGTDVAPPDGTATGGEPTA